MGKTVFKYLKNEVSETEAAAQLALELDQDGFILLPKGSDPHKIEPYLSHDGLTVWSILKNLDEVLEEFDVPGALVFLKIEDGSDVIFIPGDLKKPENAKIVLYR